MNWELVVEHTPGAMENSTYRLMIPEGWLYRYGVHLVFVPHPSTALTSTALPLNNPYVANTYGATDARNQ